MKILRHLQLVKLGTPLQMDGQVPGTQTLDGESEVSTVQIQNSTLNRAFFRCYNAYNRRLVNINVFRNVLPFIIRTEKYAIPSPPIFIPLNWKIPLVLEYRIIMLV